MAVDTDIPYSTKEGIDYLIKFTLFPKDKLPEEIKIPIVDIVIETDASVDDISNSAFSLLQITQIIHDYAIEHNAIYYCYCSDKPIKRSKTKAHLNHQEYRSKLFCKMFEKNNNSDFINRTVIISDPQKGNHHIHLITKLENEYFVDIISNLLNELDK